jgi:hypothetical protein
MRKIRILLWCWLAVQSVSFAQNITQIEYFIDNDTGYGNGTNVNFTSSNNVTVNFNISISGALGEGFHFLNIRAKDENEKWGLVSLRPFYNQNISNATLANITAMEYFFDNDPGFGNGTSISFTASTTLTQNFQISMPVNLSEGFHFLTVRAKDVNNKWSIVGLRPFYHQPIQSNTLANITAMEYFFDNDPGYGSGTALSFIASSNVNQSYQIPVPGNLSEGFHFLTLRARDANNKWSLVSTKPFFKQSLANNTLLKIVSLEYFIDTDPGFGNGTPLALTASTNISKEFLVNLDNLGNGNHTLLIRAKDANNKWSLLSIRDFIVQNNIIIIQNMPAQWCATNNFNIPIVLYGTFTAGNVFTAQISDANGSFSSPVTIGTLTSTSAGTLVGNIPNTVNTGSGYKIRVISSNPSVENSPVKPFELLSVCPPPCAGILTLQSWADDYLAGNVVKEANATSGSIVASNQVRNNANVIYRSGKSITLNPGFSVNSGAVFKTEFGGCN